ncbi:NAD(P)H-binding protein [Amycolatopsis sp.]|uniref:NAD(P)H-binding protein n=1 Tax=Amycolatopsis sp. TaxID=37632 RepID=UPI002B799C22|nr:NAD(P)H-binding protein [Amycolatopsis sp.]HVV11769.1 NAD(P)H-binding protein [Amycolatopsis sp.]
MTVWVEGATGKAGKRVVAALAEAGLKVRAASRHPGAPAGNVTPVRFDWYDESTWDESLAGAEALFLKGLDSDENAADLMARLIKSAAQANRVVLMSQHGVERSPAHTPRGRVEQAVRDSGRDWTILRPNWLMQNFDEDEYVYAAAVREDDEVVAGSGDHVVSFVDSRDVADAAAVVLSQDGHQGRDYNLTGPEALTYGQIAEILAKVSGRPIRHVDADLARHRAHFAKSGRSDAWADHMMQLFELIRADIFAPVTDSVERLTGHAPRTFEDYARETFAA